MSKIVGPSIAVTGSCFNCMHERSVSYAVQSDSGHEVYCDHPSSGGKRVGDTSWRTPDWCPEGARLREIIASARDRP